jgi:hypothetical protein
METERDQQTVAKKDRRSGGRPEPDPNPEQRTGGASDKLGKSVQHEDRK